MKHRLVSCYALFKRWLLLSLLSSCLHFITIFFTLSINLETLYDDLGSFPLDNKPYRLLSDCQIVYKTFLV